MAAVPKDAAMFPRLPTVTKALLSIDPRARIETDPPAREARMDSALDKSAFLAVLSDAGYPDMQ